jgi:hypothetical protein
VWSVFGVQSRARRTVVGVPANGDGEAAPDGDDAGDGAADTSGAPAHGGEVGAGAAEPQAPEAAGAGVTVELPQPASNAVATRSVRSFMRTRFLSWDEDAAPGIPGRHSSRVGLLPSLV